MGTRHTRHLVWTEAPPVTAAFAVRGLAGVAAAVSAPSAGRVDEAPSADFYVAPRDRAIYLLHIGAEVEHALMAQYLYAAYSLGGPHLSEGTHRRLAEQWKATILEIAREEMGHLATVENLLTLIGGPLSFEREDYPVPADLYPDRKSTRLNSSHIQKSRMPSSA